MSQGCRTTAEPDLQNALQKIRSLQPKALNEIRKGGYIFARRPAMTPPANDEERWEDLAFWLYSYLCEADNIARHALNDKEA